MTSRSLRWSWEYRRALLCAALMALLSPAVAGAADQAVAARGPDGLLVVINGDRLRGTLAVSDRPGQIVWQSPAFVEPLQFSLSQVQTVMFDAQPSRPRGEYRIALSGGDVVYGSLGAIDRETCVVRCALGTLRIKSAAVALLSRRRTARAPQSGFEPLVLQKVVSDKEHFDLVNGEIVYGKLTAYDARTKTFSFQVGNQAVSRRADDIAEIALANTEPNHGPVRLEYADGTRISGELLRVGNGQVVLKSSAFFGGLALPLADLRFLRASIGSTTRKRWRTEATLLIDGGRLHGWLVSNPPESGRSSLAWQLSGVSTAAAIRADAAFSIVFGQPNLAAITEERPAGDRIFLRLGDVVNCTVVAIDGHETVVRTTASNVKRVPNERVKAVELGPHSRATLADDKLTRLLTVPRLQKDNPPTHVLGSVGGDYLRGWLLGLREGRVSFQVGNARREFLLERIACIVWLNNEARPAPLPAGAGLIHATDVAGASLTLTAAKLDQGTMVGQNELLGECRLPLDRLIELRFGLTPSKSKAAHGYRSWQATSAPQPKAFAGDEAAGGQRHAETSTLIGRPAPDITLEQLDGSKFRLANERGKVVVLDFWASWCAPCVKCLPQTAELVGRFPRKKVQLVAINLQESRGEASQAITRMKVDALVPLDHDGQVAASYGALSMPYTVVIAADGKVVGAFTGYGPGLAGELKAAIDAALADVSITAATRN
ncbi:MAG TPA: redoxin family protein [Pirellulales bacterium]